MKYSVISDKKTLLFLIQKHFFYAMPTIVS